MAKPSGSIVAVAVVQFLGSLAVLAPSALFLAEELQIHHLYPQSYRLLHPAVYVVLIAIPICFGLLGIVTSMGLLRLRGWARRLTLFLSIVPVSGCAFLVILHPSSVFPPEPGQGAILAMGDIYLFAYKLLLVILIPVSIWWLVLMSQQKVRSQFDNRSPY
ncbi:MAG: hypothetical protein ACYDDS_15375 [Candidatus Sulfotelmatobacter sp.]